MGMHLGRRPRVHLRPLLAGAGALLAGLFDLALPPACLLCHCPLGSPRAPLCRSCFDGLPLLRTALCAGCGRAPARSSFEFCAACGHKAFHRDGLAALAFFRGGARDLVHAFKYRGDLAAGRFLGSMLGEKAAAEVGGGWDAVVPVPIHRTRLRQRGFNQAAILGRGVSRATGVPLHPAALVRRQDTPPLAGLGKGRRIRAVRGTVGVRSGRPVAGKRILLVDDVVTTGATVEECARRLKGAGAEAVAVVAAARTPGDPP